MILLKNANVYAPSHIGKKDILLGGGKILLISDCIDSSYVSSVGEYVNIFEKMIEDFTKSKKAIALVNGTSALHLALKVSGIKPNEEIICPSLTFVATANAISYMDAKPHFVD